MKVDATHFTHLQTDEEIKSRQNNLFNMQQSFTFSMLIQKKAQQSKDKTDGTALKDEISLTMYKSV